MSTKTTLKRIALVAVSALGFGLMSVVPVNAANPDTDSTGDVVSVSATVTGKALRVGVESTIRVTFTGPAVLTQNDSGTALTGGYPSSAKINPNMRVLVAPALATTTTVTPATSSAELVEGGAFAEIANVSANGRTTSTVATMGDATITMTAQDTAAYAGIKWTPTHAGSYTFLFWDDVNRDGAIGGATEKSATVTFVVGNSIASITTTTVINNGSTVATDYGAVVRVCLKDENGNATVPSGSDSVTVAESGSATWKSTFVQGADTQVSGAGTSTAYLLTADFDAAGCAYLGLVNATAETVSITPSVVGGTTTPTVTTSTVTFNTPTAAIADTTKAAIGISNKVTVRASAGEYQVPVATAPGFLFTSDESTAGAKRVQIGIVDGTGGVAYGNANIRANTLLTTRSTAVTGGAIGTVSWTGPSIAVAGLSYRVVLGGSTSAAPLTSGMSYTTSNSFTVTALQNDSANAGITASPSAATVATGGTVRFVVNVVDSYSRVRSGIAVTASISGRNSGKALASGITDADGNVVFSYVDTNASAGTTLTDTLTFTTTSPLGASRSNTAVVTYVSDLTVSTVAVTTPNTTAGVANLANTPKAIAFADGAEGGAFSISAKVTTSTSAVLAGIPVTWTVAGDGAAILSTTATAYTDSTGTASASIYGWKAGTYTVTATALGVAGTGTVTFAQEDAASARTVSASAADNVVTAKVVDRFGNPVKGSRIYAKIDSGTGYFGGSLLKADTTTDSNGEAKFVVIGDATITVSNIDFSSPAGTQVGQTSAPKGYAQNAASATALAALEFTAYTAGTSTTAEEGVGASFDAAGVSTATVTITGNTPEKSAAEAASDAALEAIDAANAATDAANLAAEAADAATVAAEEARDAADAATAAVEALASEVATLMAALKAQITTLAKTVAKIAKKVKA